jgi:hypothetical protein
MALTRSLNSRHSPGSWAGLEGPSRLRSHVWHVSSLCGFSLLTWLTWAPSQHGGLRMVVLLTYGRWLPTRMKQKLPVFKPEFRSLGTLLLPQIFKTWEIQFNSFFFFFLVQGFELRAYMLTLHPTPAPTAFLCVCNEFFRDSVKRTICPGWLRTEILLISAS